MALTVEPALRPFLRSPNPVRDVGDVKSVRTVRPMTSSSIDQIGLLRLKY